MIVLFLGPTGVDDDDVMRQLGLGLLVCLLGCATAPAPASSPVPLKVALRPNCHGSSFGRVDPQLRVESALATELNRQFPTSAFAPGDVLEVEVTCERIGMMPSSAMKTSLPGFVGGGDIPAPRPVLGGGLVWICLGNRIECEVDPVTVPEASLVDAKSVAQFIALLLADKMKSDASLLAPGAIAK